MLYRTLFLIGAGLGCAVPAAAQHAPIENGQPCVAEVCVDDDLASLLNLPWLDAPSRPATASADASLSDTLRADDDVMKTLGTQWAGHLFGKAGLAALSHVKAVCRDMGVWQRPSAEFMGKDGSRTRVIFEAEPGKNGNEVVFRVAMIVRHVPDGASSDSIAALGRAMGSRYEGLSRYASSEAPGAQWQPDGPHGPALILVAAVGDPQQRAADLARHPLCESD